LAEVAANVVPFKRRAYEAVAREFGPVIAARARRGRQEEEEEDDESLLRGWWGLSLGGHQKEAQRQQQQQASSRQRSSLQNQILPASGVAMKAAREKQQRQ
jgi:hypothetical protein